MSASDLAACIDHTLLRPDATAAEIDRLCDEVARFGFASACLNPVWVRRAAARLDPAGGLVCTVVGFPLGANVAAIKAAEARRAIEDGAREIDMVLAIGALKGGDLEAVRRDIAGVVEACRSAGARCKVILETAILDEPEKVAACRIALQAGADFVKTSTGFGGGGASVADVALMRSTVGPEMGVKASGGIRTAADAQALLAAGATRLGTSASLAIVGAADPGAV